MNWQEKMKDQTETICKLTSFIETDQGQHIPHGDLFCVLFDALSSIPNNYKSTRSDSRTETTIYYNKQNGDYSEPLLTIVINHHDCSERMFGIIHPFSENCPVSHMSKAWAQIDEFVDDIIVGIKKHYS